MDADIRLTQTWENVWRTDDVEAEHRDVVAVEASANTLIFRPYVDRMLARYERPTLLEAGCGLGQWLYYALERSDGNVVGLDLTSETLARVRSSKTLDRHRHRLDLVVGDMRRMPLADASFDLIFSFGVIEHVLSADSQKTVREFFRVLRPGGRLLLATPNLWSVHTLTRPISQMLGTWRVGFERSISPRKLASYCRHAGFEIEECGVMDTGQLFGSAMTSLLPALRGLSRSIERRQHRFGFMAYTVAVKR
ncbi:MAG: class I SAM-dependent methyltransferase [Candidatus Eremiobacteraeota bacterium]|nr:class I SAM-dependent methyltransferase [Candidatus Eremiobacteraeota bacterium]